MPNISSLLRPQNLILAAAVAVTGCSDDKKKTPDQTPHPIVEKVPARTNAEDMIRVTIASTPLPQGTIVKDFELSRKPEYSSSIKLSSMSREVELNDTSNITQKRVIFLTYEKDKKTGKPNDQTAEDFKAIFRRLELNREFTYDRQLHPSGGIYADIFIVECSPRTEAKLFDECHKKGLSQPQFSNSDGAERIYEGYGWSQAKLQQKLGVPTQVP